MDKTLVNIDTVDAWMQFLFDESQITNQQLALSKQFNDDYQAGILNVNASYSFITKLLKTLAQQISLAQLINLRTKFFNKLVVNNISKIAINLLQQYSQKTDHITILITATIDFIAQPVFDFLPTINHLIATDTNINDESNVNPVYHSPNIGVGKLEKYYQWQQQQNFNIRSTTLYSDSINDLPLMSHVNKAIAVDPDHLLTKVATYNQWPIISFKN